ncbi:hypothetical protein ACSQ67_001753 [Phaseolus vulgaris]
MADKQPHLNGAYYGPAIPRRCNHTTALNATEAAVAASSESCGRFWLHSSSSLASQSSYSGWFSNYDVITHMNSFRQYTKSSSPMSAVFSGSRVLTLDNEQISELNQDKSDGVYDIYVKLNFRIRYRLGDLISGDFKPKVKCDLKVPVPNNGTLTFFQATKCDVDY